MAADDETDRPLSDKELRARKWSEDQDAVNGFMRGVGGMVVFGLAGLAFLIGLILTLIPSGG
jgi:hypothetical protein